MKRNLSAVFFALLIVLSGALFFLQQAAQHRDEAASGAVALVTASDLAKLGSSGLQAGLSEQAVGSLMADVLKRSGREGDRYRLVMRTGKELAASNWPDEAAPRPLSLTEKPLFDLILGLPAAGAKLTPTAQGAHAAAPLVVGGQRVGMVEIVQTSKTVGPALISMLQWGAIGIGVLAIVGLALVQPKLGAWAGVVVPLGVAFVLGQLTGSNLASTAQVLLDNLNTSARAIDDAMRAVAVSNGLALTGDVARLDTAVVAGAVDGSALTTSLLFLGGLGAIIGAFISFGAAASTWRALKENPTAYTYVAPALIGMLALAFFPFFYGFVLSFTDTTLLNQGASWSDRWVGLANYASILGDFNFGGSGAAFNYQNFYWTMGVTIVWTASNVVFGVSIGLGMALLLNIKGLRGVAIYRTLLILPWAIPNYITALTWKGMFHPQFGAINQAIQAFGGQPVQWFDAVGPSFITGLATNVWLSFPFMMVVALGALQAVDEDMYEAARIDGASPWQQFWLITLPSLRPALLPAIIVSVVWTFNMFNVIYLVSAGQPSGANEILVTRAYRIAFEEYRYGYAAAYSVVIFLILLIYGVFQIRATSATEANNK
jgi:arabinogalactan oligomer/maltooligosaccharide transport system permease protein